MDPASNFTGISPHGGGGRGSDVLAAPAVSMPMNGPESPPVVYNPALQDYDDDEDERCRACHTEALYTDWRQGDRVCTNCGVVAEGHLRDTRPEWKDFNEAEDLAKGLPSGARSGLVAVDESKYLGGLQPTTLSKHAFGGESHGGYGMARIRKRLKSTNKRLDHMMEKIHSQALKDAKLDRQIRLKRGRHTQEDWHDSTDDSTVRPELEHLVLQEEEDAHRLQAALYAEKWSLDRALLLYGQSHEQRPVSDEERDDLLEKLDSTLRKASEELYTAYAMLSHASRELQLPERVQTEAAHRLVRFVTRRDGLRIPGIASRLSQESMANGSATQRKEAAKQLKEHNQRKQIAALGAALLFLTARTLGWTRSIFEICDSFANHDDGDDQRKDAALIKAKHVSKALKEIQSLFPEYSKHSVSSNIATNSSTADMVATANFVEHSLRKLQLPPVAEASIRSLMIQLRDDQVQSGWYSGMKLPTLCASVAYLVCYAGSTMQRLAQQFQEALRNKAGSPLKSPPAKRKRREGKVLAVNVAAKDDESTSSSDEEDRLLGGSRKSKRHTTDDDDAPFDVFSHDPLVEDPTEKQEYELRRMWDAWAEQMSWARSVVDLEQSCGVSRTVIQEFYKKELYPRRRELLQALSNAVQRPLSVEARDPHSLQDTPLAPILLAHIETAAAVMSSR